MKGTTRFAAIGTILILSVMAVFVADCNAQCAGTTGAYYGYYGYLPSYVYVRDYIPYFALHPPVYYSLPVPRTYGYSPFAYPPGTMTPEVEVPKPEVIPNKYVPSKFRQEVETGRVTAKPLRIANPYVVAQDSPSPSKGVASR